MINFLILVHQKIHLKCDVIPGSVVNGIRELIIFLPILDKPPGYKLFCGPEMVHYKNKSIRSEY